MSTHVDRNDRLGVWSNSSLGELGIQAVGVWANVNQHRKRIREQNGARRRDEGKVGNDNLVSGLESDSRHRNFESGGSICDREPVTGVMKTRESFLELQSFGAGRTPPDPSFQYGVQSPALGVVE